MKRIQSRAPQPTAVANRFKIDLSSLPGRARCDIDIFSSGLKLVVMHTALHQPIQIQRTITEPIIGLGFCLAGEFDASFMPSKPRFNIRAGQSGLFTFPQHIEITEYLPADHMLRIYLMLEGEILSSFIQGDEDYFSPVIKSLEKKRPDRVVHSTTTLMRAALYQILHCPYCGKAKHIYLESKAMELLSHKLAQLYPSTICPGNELKHSDHDRIIHAAEALVNNLDNPPDIKELARSVGLSRSKLHRYFRRVYGVSPFEYLRNHRLQTAMLLLQSGEINVTEAALSVGYANLSYFAKAFKTMFGVAPGELLHHSRLN
ncbi:AraC family transcriptional regulator [Desulfobacter postgatei]|jgi:AraC-like DNA-binding protein|uniref:helix-turn-helix transcriptional regulator n=1 Tax=Desulfobacter postgatei TaxID=2293 RepID=UPI002A36FE07|nr:AraC family transcriptional regulator [Desulfobacter postgatei]MDX9964565.1 AraC family transcriptional regulator [Desulfobacter postgatei]